MNFPFVVFEMGSWIIVSLYMVKTCKLDYDLYPSINTITAASHPPKQGDSTAHFKLLNYRLQLEFWTDWLIPLGLTKQGPAFSS